VDVTPKQEFCKQLTVFYLDFKNQKKYYLREGESTVEKQKTPDFIKTVQKNANRR
jgi:hypothetical protein